NPLLLSLLVMIYAHSGAPAAKRHRIYAQAVQTLVSVRNPAAGNPGLAEGDLRARFGEIALAIFDHRIQEFPTPDDVLAVIASLLGRNGKTSAYASEAVVFLQRVAEETGLLSVHHVAAGGQPTVTFMHHSFLEYYAAVGIVARGDISQLPTLADTPRWRE